MLRAEADRVLELVRLRECCRDIGEITPTGSYFLDLMIYPDIDLYLPPTSTEALMSLAATLAKNDCVKRINFAKGGPGDLADGLYLKPVIEHGTWERPWKIDMWSLRPDVVREKQRELVDLRRRMTPDQRQVILDYKWRVITDAGRTPMFSGIYIYRAVMDLGITDAAEITNYLRENGIDV